MRRATSSRSAFRQDAAHTTGCLEISKRPARTARACMRCLPTTTQARKIPQALRSWHPLSAPPVAEIRSLLARHASHRAACSSPPTSSTPSDPSPARPRAPPSIHEHQLERLHAVKKHAETCSRARISSTWGPPAPSSSFVALDPSGLLDGDALRSRTWRAPLGCGARCGAGQRMRPTCHQNHSVMARHRRHTRASQLKLADTAYANQQQTQMKVIRAGGLQTLYTSSRKSPALSSTVVLKRLLANW